VSAAVVSLAEWREARFGPDDDLPPAGPSLRLVAAGEGPHDAFRLEVFLARARAVMAEQRPTEVRRRHLRCLTS
jgi:hypothetical protein